MGIAIAIIGFIVALLVLIIAHELGHFIVSKRAGVVIEEFGIGLPPRIFGVKRGETIYSLNLIPLGAFVKAAGENDPSVPGSLASKGPWTRMGVYAAGPMVNIFMAFVILSAYFMVPTDDIRGKGAMVNSVTESSPAKEAGIEPGDIILRIDEQQIHDWEDIREAVNTSAEEEKTLYLDRDGEPFQVNLKPEFTSQENRYTIGVWLAWGIVTGVEEGSPAAEADIRTGDTILSIGEKAVYSNGSMTDALNSAKAGEEVSVVLLRTEEIVTTNLNLSAQDGDQLIGADTRWVSDTRIETQRSSFWQALYRGGDFIVHIPYLIKESIPLMIEDSGKAVVGPVGAGQLTVEIVESFGFSNILFLAGLISVGLAIFNFIPIPPLDGGGILVASIEGIRRGKRLSPKTVRLVYTIGTAIIITIFVVIMYNDIARLISGGSFL
jgi:regulator of sigma E protease